MTRSALRILRERLPARRAALLVASCALGAGALGACASGDGDAGDDGGGSSGREAAAEPETPRAPPSIDSFPDETRAFMEEGLRQFSRGDEKWPATRAEWLGAGEREAQFLVQALWTALLRMQALNQPAQVEKARHELAIIGLPSVPLLAGILGAGEVSSVRDPSTGEVVPVRMDDLQRREASEVLTIVGEPAVPAVVSAFENAESKSARRWSVRTLGNMGDRGGPGAADVLVRASKDADDFVRVEAVHSMQYRTDDATRAALFEALADAEEVVRTNAAESLVHRQEPGAVEAIRAASEAARGAGRIVEAKRLEQSAARLEARMAGSSAR